MELEIIEYETVLTNGEIITSYLACAIAEGFCEGEGASEEDILRAWSYIIGTRLWTKLQGWYGRTANTFIEEGIISKEGKILIENNDNT